MMPDQAVPKEAHCKVHLMLTNDQVAFLDEICAAIRRNTGSVVNRSALARAILAPVFEFNADYVNCGSEREIGMRIFRRMKGVPPK